MKSFIRFTRLDGKRGVRGKWHATLSETGPVHDRQVRTVCGILHTTAGTESIDDTPAMSRLCVRCARSIAIYPPGTGP